MDSWQLDTVLPWSLGLLAALLMMGLLLYYRLRLGLLPRVLALWIWAARALFMLLVLLLLLDPHLAWRRIVHTPPRIGIFLDNSLSMANHSTSSASTVYAQVAALADWARANHYEPVVATFGETLTLQDVDQIDYQPSERLTDFNLLQEWWPAANLAAGFIFSDGVATTGPGPGNLKGPPDVPLFTIGVGDTLASVDLSIDAVRYPLSLLAQEQGRMEITVRGRNAQGLRRSLYLFHGDELIFSRQVRFSSQDHLETLTAPVVGRLDATRFRLEREVLPDEANIENNRREIEIDVLPGRRQITLITGALSPNSGLWWSAVRQVSQARTQHLVFLRGAWRGDEAAFWQTPQDLVVLDNYPTTQHSAGHLDRLLEKFRREGTAVLVAEGPDSGHRAFVRLLRELGITVRAAADTAATIRPVTLLERTGLLALDRSGIIALARADFPPAASRFYLPPSSNRRLSALLQRESGGWLAAYGSQSRGKRGVLLLPALMTLHLQLGRTAGGGFIPAAIQALLEWSLEPEGFSSYVVRTDRQVYHLGERVRFRGLQRDRAGERMLQPILTLEVEGPDSEFLVTLTYDFEAAEYKGEYWPSEAGAHRYRVEGLPAEEAGNGWQRFDMQAGRVELEMLSQNRYGLERLAVTTGGVYAGLSEAAELWQDLTYLPRSATREARFNLWQLTYLGPAMLLLLAIEWSLRRRAGLI